MHCRLSTTLGHGARHKEHDARFAARRRARSEAQKAPEQRRITLSIGWHVACSVSDEMNATRTTAWLLSAAAVLLLAACAEPSVAPFAELDLDGDGRISREEAMRDVVLAALFADADEDDDGELTPFEYLQAAHRP